MKKTAPKRAVFKNQCPKSYRVCPLVTKNIPSLDVIVSGTWNVYPSMKKDLPSFKNLEGLSLHYSALKLFTGFTKAALIAK